MVLADDWLALYDLAEEKGEHVDGRAVGAPIAMKLN